MILNIAIKAFSQQLLVCHILRQSKHAVSKRIHTRIKLLSGIENHIFNFQDVTIWTGDVYYGLLMVKLKARSTPDNIS